jgi:LuxR family transcriptional activator of conjugal transfer of Ti plasmids
MNSAERAFLDAIQTASDEAAFERIAKRATQCLGFRWFAYLRLTDNAPVLISSYPKSWTDRCFELGYQNLDPVVRRARQQHGLVCWGGEGAGTAGKANKAVLRGGHDVLNHLWRY